MATTPSLAADLLLLSVGERASFTTRGPVAHAVAAGALADELLAGRPLAEVAPDRRTLAQVLDRRGAHDVELTSSRLVAAGALVPHRHKVLRVFPRHGYAVVGWGARRQAERRLLAALQPTEPASVQDAALAAIAAAAGLARAHLPLATAADRALLAAHLNRLSAVLGPDLTEVVHALRAVYRREDSGDGVVLFVPVSDGEGYGDSGGAGDSSGGSSDGGDGGGGGGD